MHRLLIRFFILLITFSVPLIAAEKTAHDIVATKNFAYVIGGAGALIFVHGFGEYMGWISTSLSHNEKPISQQPVQGLEEFPTPPLNTHSKLTSTNRMVVGAGFTLIIAPLWYLLSTAAHKSINSPGGYLNTLGRLSRL